MLEKFLRQIKLDHPAPLDPGFKPAILFKKYYEELLQANDNHQVEVALIRSKGNIFRFRFCLLKSNEFDPVSFCYLKLNLKFILWAVGGHTLYFSGPQKWFDQLKIDFSESGSSRFDGQFMARIYDKPWAVHYCEPSDLPQASEEANTLGGHLEGCRIGFDLGASDYKLAAVQDGKAIFTTEIRWDPVVQTDPDYHWQRIVDGLELAASHLPRVDAIGGSSAGIIHENQIRVASLFRSVDHKDFAEKVTPLFNKLKEKWQVPFVTLNDGDVSALAGSLSTHDKGVLGIAMGSSLAVGYLNQKGQITGQLNELAFAPIDFNQQAACDEWSGTQGAGVMYFSQQAVNRLAVENGYPFAKDMLLPERLKVIQANMDKGDLLAKKIFTTLGVYLGYTIPFYEQFYDISKMMVFGRVLSGKGGDRIIEVAQNILQEQFPRVAAQVNLSVPDEKFRRVGQAVAAASLPELR